jgi:hypothetical protein
MSYLISDNSKCKLARASRFYKVVPSFSDIMMKYAEIMGGSTSLHHCLPFLIFCRKCIGHMAFERRIHCIFTIFPKAL